MRTAWRYLETRLDGACVYRAGRRVLSDIHWRIRPGERWVVMGPNGSGKTQLLKVIAGIVRPAPAPRATVRWRLGNEWQEVPYEIKQHVGYVGPERQDKYQRYGWNAAAADVVGTGLHGTDIPLDALTRADQQRVAQMLKRLGVEAPGRRPFLELSYGERRMILLARALIARPKLLLLDEVFTGLDRENHARLSQWLKRLSGALPLLLATHQLEDIPVNATHALVLRGGRVVSRGPIGSASLARHFRPRVGSGVAARRPRGRRNPLAQQAAGTLVQLRHAHVYLEERCALHDVSVSVGAGEFWVIHGGNGAGKTTLLRTLYGDHGVASGGSVERAGIHAGVPLEYFRERTGLSAPDVQARYPRSATVSEVVLSGCHASIGLHRRASRSERAAALRVLRRLHLARWARRRIAELSYGQTRRVLFARAIVRSPRLLLLDEPFDSVDAVTRALLGAQIMKLSGQGVALVVTAHTVGEWSAYATHELELAAGRVRYGGVLRRR